jgi:hypothetical protein
VIYSCIASEFATTSDLDAYNRAIAEGKTEDEALAVGDNCIGCWGDSTAAGTGPCCAIPPDDMVTEYGAVAFAKHQQVIVTNPLNGKAIVCTIKDRMPWKKDITNGAGIDLNPDACEALVLPYGAMVPVTWGPIEKAQAV